MAPTHSLLLALGLVFGPQSVVAQHGAGAQPGTAVQVQQGQAQTPGPQGPASQPAGNAPAPAMDAARLDALRQEREALRRSLTRLSGMDPANSRRPLKINGDEVPRDVVEREILYLTGYRQIQEKIIEILIDEQIQDQIKNQKADPKRFEVMDKELDEHIKTTRAQWEKENPDKGKFEDYLRATNTSWEEYRTLARNTKIFDRIFFDGHPRNWPDITAEAVMASGGDQGQAFWERFRDSVPPIYFAEMETTVAAARAALAPAKMELVNEVKSEQLVELKVKVDLGPQPPPASQPAGQPPAPPVATIATLSIKIEKKPTADQVRTEVKALPDNNQDAIREPVVKALNVFRDTTVAEVAKATGKPPAACFTGEVIPFWLGIYRTWVLKKLTEWSDVKYASDGLPNDVVLSVNKKTWSVADASKALLQKAKPEDFERALTEIVIRTGLKQELKKAGAWLSDEKFREEFKAYRDPYDKTPFTMEVMALTFKGYPSLEAYKERWRLLKSYENLIAKEINDDNLKAHVPVCKNFLGDGRINVQFIRIPAFDDARGTWREDGWARAKADADKVMTDIEKGTITFDAALKEHGRYKMQDTEKGMLGLKSFNELRQKLGESEYLDFVNGYSVAQILLNEAKEGQVVGPLRCNDGYVICKLVSRVPPGGAVNIEDAKTRDLVKQDYITTRFLKWAGEVAAKVAVE
jgi:hypothetical protein